MSKEFINFLNFKKKIFIRKIALLLRVPLFSLTSGFCLGSIIFFADIYIVALCIILSVATSFKLKNYIFLVSIIVGIIYSAVYMDTLNAKIEALNSRFLNIAGIITNSPSSTNFSQNFIIADNINGVNVLVDTEKYPQQSYGNEISAEGEVKLITEDTFNIGYVNYLKSLNVFLILKSNAVKSSSTPNLYSIGNTIREKFESIIYQNSSFPSNTIINGIVLGTKSTIPKEIEDLFIATSIFHIISVSGFNFYILYSTLFKFLKIINRRVLYILSFVIILTFLIIVGTYNVSATRATLMLFFLMTGNLLGKRVVPVILILFTLAVFQIEYPLNCTNISLQLSLLATSALFFASPLIKKILDKIFPKFLTELLAPTLAANFFILPVSLLIFGQANPLGILANLTILPFVPIVMFSSILSIIFGIIGISFLTEILCRVSEKTVEGIIIISRFISQFTFPREAGIAVMIALALLIIILVAFYDFKKYKEKLLIN